MEQHSMSYTRYKACNSRSGWSINIITQYLPCVCRNMIRIQSREYWFWWSNKTYTSRSVISHSANKLPFVKTQSDERRIRYIQKLLPLMIIHSKNLYQKTYTWLINSRMSLLQTFQKLKFVILSIQTLNFKRKSYTKF